MSGKDSYKHTLKYTGLFGGVQGLNIAITLVRNKFVALLLGPAGMGLISLLNTITNFFSQATNLGISFSAVRHLSETFDSGDHARTVHFVKIVRSWSLLTALAGMLALIVLCPIVNSQIFSSGDHTAELVCLSPVIAMLAVTGGETAILKGARRLKPLAAIQLFNIVAALAVSLPLYYFFGMKGIVPVVVILALVGMACTMYFSCRLYPYAISGSKGILGEGMDMVRLGVAYVSAGIFGSGSEMAIRSFLNVEGGLDVVGLYNAGYILTITYAGMVFSAMDTDFFPRLSAVAHDNRAVSNTVNRQIEVSLLLVSPLLSALIVLLPVLLPVLYSNSFAGIVQMGQIAVFSMYFKAITLPLEYINLAKGNSKAYLLLEIFYDITITILIIFGYRLFGLWGTGLALSVCHLLNLAAVLAYSKIRYGVNLSMNVAKFVAIHLPLGIIAYCSSFAPDTLSRWLVGMAATAASTAVSVYIIIYKKTDIWNKIKNKTTRHD